MRRYHFSDKAPAWWPEGEAWPPTRSPNVRNWHKLRGRFFWRLGCGLFFMVGVMIVISGLLVIGIDRLSPLDHPFGSPQFFARAAGFIIFVLVVAGFLMIGREVRRMAKPFGNLLDAAGKVADGDYSVRVAERGPSEVRALAQAFNSMTTRLKTNSEQRQNLLADISHELRTPLTIIQGNLEGMLDGIYPAEPRTIQAVLDETHTLARIIDDLRTLSMTESGQLKLQLEQVEMGDLLEDVATAFTPQAAAHQVALTVTLQPDLPPVEADPTRIREVITNLLSNALRYTQPGGKISLACAIPPEAASAMQITISDTGTGIASADLPYIFGRFYKSSDSNGSGLGLAISKGLVTAHHGEISAASEPGRGTVMTILLPL